MLVIFGDVDTLQKDFDLMEKSKRPKTNINCINCQFKNGCDLSVKWSSNYNYIPCDEGIVGNPNITKKVLEIVKYGF
jgi:hypothetical protein